MSRPTALRVLTYVLVAVGAYALMMVAAGGLVQEMFDVLGFGADGAQVNDGDPREYVLFIQGVLGAVIFGWVLLMLAVVSHGLTPDPDGPWWNVLVRSVSGWFLVDTGLSLAMGSWQHALFNVVFLAALAVPLAALRPARTGPAPD